MIPNCVGCKEEVRVALDAQDENGLHLATADNFPNSFPNCKGHFCLIIVDDDGKVVMW